MSGVGYSCDCSCSVWTDVTLAEGNTSFPRGVKSVFHSQPNNCAIFAVFNDSLFAEMRRETSTHSSNAVRHSTTGFDILVSIPIDICDMANAQVLSFISQFA